MKMTKAAFFVLCACTAQMTFANAVTCHQTSEEEIASLFDRWNDSLKTGDPKKVVRNYAPDSTLLPTLSPKPRSTEKSKIEYFTEFLEKKPSGKIDKRSINIHCNTAIDIGLYTFTFADGSSAHARYSYTYKWNGKEWLITSHHSSLKPE